MDVSPKIKIAVLTNGFVHVGECSVSDGWLIITNARNIRRWGTETGLGELATKGPRPNSVIDQVGTIEAPIGSVIFLVDCDPSKW